VSPQRAQRRLARSRGACALLAALATLLAPVAARADVEALAKELAPYQGRRVDAIELAGNKVTKEYVIRREIQTEPGQPLDLALVAQDYQRLENLAIFADIRVVAEAREPDEVELTFQFRELPSWIPLLAVSYNEQDGVSVGPGLAAANLAGRDITLSAKAYFGGATQYSASLRWPWITGDHVSLDFRSARLERDDTLRDFRETSTEVRPRFGRYLGEHGRLGASFAWFQMRSDVDGKTLSPSNEDDLLRLGASFGWDTRDSWTHPRSGWLNEVEVIHTGGFLGGDGDFWTLTADLRRWLPTGRRQRLFVGGLVSYQTGTVGENVPVYLDYRMGGANSIRGYNVEELGRRLYGKSQLLGTLEYSFVLLPMRALKVIKWSVRLGLEAALFADAGIAWSRPEDMTWRRARGGVGAGLRVLVPGSEMLRLDLGWSPEGGFHLHFAGSTKAARQRNRIR